MQISKRKWTNLALAAAVVAGAAGVPLAFSSPAVDFSAAAREATKNLVDYISVDTTVPPGNEQKGAEFLAALLRKDGIETQLYQTAPGRACAYARLKGNGKKRPIILLNHIDVVPAKPEDWQHHPFKGAVIDGEIWGRGALDMKGAAIAQLEALLLIKRSGRVPDRDIIFLATPDEEVGGVYGAGWFVKNHPELVKDAEYLLNEGFFIDTTDSGKHKYWGVDISEKSPLWLKLTATGDAGHASMPIANSATNRLARAMDRIVKNPPGPTLLPAVKTFFTDIAKTEEPATAKLYANIETTIKNPSEYAKLLDDKLKSAMLRNTVSLTVIKAGYKTNVIPGEAECELDCRLLPGVSKDDFVAQVKQVIDDPSIKISELEWEHTPASPYDTELFEVIKQVAAKNDPGVPVVPLVVPWFTDSHWFRQFGTIAYGFEPIPIDPAHLASMHGKNERVPEKGFADCVRMTYEILARICGVES